MVYFRLSIFEFTTEASSRHHAIRRHYVSAIFWISTSTLSTGSLLIVGYIVRACVHACAIVRARVRDRACGLPCMAPAAPCER